jgi:hypothetical protein
MRELYISGVLRERWDDTTRTYTAFSGTGVQLEQREYTPAENVVADSLAATEVLNSNETIVHQKLAVDFAAAQAILNQTNADIRTDPSQEIKDLARAVRRLTRMALDDFSGTE